MVVMPMDKDSHLHEGETRTYDNEKQYQALTGFLTYVAMSTQPDISYITQYLSPSHIKDHHSVIGMPRRESFIT